MNTGLIHIVCMAKNSVIGVKGRLPWNLEEDLKRFKYLTMGRSVLMGRETFDSLPVKLGGRKVYVLSKTRRTEGDYPIYISCLEDVLADMGDKGQLMIAGGESVYRSTIDLVDEIFLTLVDKDYEGDSHYFSLDELLEDFEIDYEREIENEIPYRFLRLLRKEKA